jgi:hypothetical protein
LTPIKDKRKMLSPLSLQGAMVRPSNSTVIWGHLALPRPAGRGITVFPGYLSLRKEARRRQLEHWHEVVY